MPRGGRREGAGRKRGSSTLTKWQAIVIGARCESIYKRICRDSRRKKIVELTEPLQELWSKVHAIPIIQRPTWTKSAQFEDYQDDIDGTLYTMEGKSVDTPDDWNDVIEYTNGANEMYASPPRRGYTVVGTRPKGKKGESIRDEIINEVSGREGVSRGVVDRCWKNCRKRQSAR
jgi:hypothetical protein|tara:strand:- start:78 stop:599 length:522 start_codon:yes stop_codon:yes gene_type:complete